MIAIEKEIVTGNGNMITIVVYMTAMEDDAEGVRRDQEAGADQGRYLQNLLLIIVLPRIL